MDENVLKKYITAGKIAAEVKSDVLKIIKPGMKILDLAEFIEGELKKKGAKPAFPVNISINEIAAHYTPSHDDTKIIQPGDLVKIDIGTQVDGYVGDMAFTYSSEKNPLISAAEEVLESAIQILKPGITVGEIGKAIEEKANSLGFGLIVNLTGHTLDKHVFHGTPSIPNVDNDSKYELKNDEVIAIEPFLVKTNGYVKESSPTEIYRYLQDKSVRLPEARKILQITRDDYEKFPFAKRWLHEFFSPVKISMALRELERVSAIESYPVLKDMRIVPISQAEHTIIIQDNPIVTTR
ncbi:MAG: type II methionyl aminopeptidase [Candidatus Aenigmatarchaeota archaeon]